MARGAGTIAGPTLRTPKANLKQWEQQLVDTPRGAGTLAGPTLRALPTTHKQ